MRHEGLELTESAVYVDRLEWRLQLAQLGESVIDMVE